MRRVVSALLGAVLAAGGLAAVTAPVEAASKAKAGGSCKRTNESFPWTKIAGKAAMCDVTKRKDGTIDGYNGRWRVIKGYNTGEKCKQGYWHEAGVSIWDFDPAHMRTCVPIKYSKLYKFAKEGGACKRTRSDYPWTQIDKKAAACEADGVDDRGKVISGTWTVFRGWAAESCHFSHNGKAETKPSVRAQRYDSKGNPKGYGVCVPSRYAPLYKSWGCGLDGARADKWGANKAGEYFEGTTWWTTTTCKDHRLVTSSAKVQTGSWCWPWGVSSYEEVQRGDGRGFKTERPSGGWPVGTVYRVVDCGDPKAPLFGEWLTASEQEYEDGEEQPAPAA